MESGMMEDEKRPWIKFWQDVEIDQTLQSVAEAVEQPYANVIAVWALMQCRAKTNKPMGSLDGVWSDFGVAKVLDLTKEQVRDICDAMGRTRYLQDNELPGFARRQINAQDADRKDRDRKASGGENPDKSKKRQKNPAKSGVVQKCPETSENVQEFPGMSENLPLEGEGDREGDREEGSSPPNGGSHSPAGAGGKSAPKGSGKAGTGYPQAFEQFWKAYPRRVEKKGAFAKWQVAVKQLTAEHGSKAEAERRLIDTAASYAKGCSKLEPRFIKHPTTWLSNGCWDDEGSPAPSSTYWGGAPVPLNDPTIRHDGSGITGTGRG